jgi:integrase
LTARAVGEFRDRIRTVGVTVATARKILATLHAVLKYAISQDWVATNAAHGIKVIGPRGEGSEKIVPPSKEDVRRVIDAAGEELRLMVIFAASTGARAGEQWAIRWQDVNFDKRELRIKRRVDAYGEEGAPKSTDGVFACLSANAGDAPRRGLHPKFGRRQLAAARTPGGRIRNRRGCWHYCAGRAAPPSRRS